MKQLLLCLVKRGETPAEVLAAVRFIETHEKRYVTGVAPVLDVCGTGGDGLQTFNISTAAAFVIAGAGGYVAKHGNRAVSSRCGSSDLMEALGIRLDAAPAKMLKALRTAGIAYLHAPFYHPLFAKAQPLRQKLGVRTLFNVLGPFLNPYRLECQMIGTPKLKNLPFFAEILRLKKRKRAAIFHSRDGLDEISTTSPAEIAELRQGKVRRWTLRPGDLGFKKARLSDYAGGDKAANRKIILAILKGRERGPARDVVVINAAMGLYLSGIARDLNDGVRRAEQALDQKQALHALEKLIRISNA